MCTEPTQQRPGRWGVSLLTGVIIPPPRWGKRATLERAERVKFAKGDIMRLRTYRASVQYARDSIATPWERAHDNGASGRRHE
eukprot:6204660-Pleurochrysis_carterae.AAC.1